MSVKLIADSGSTKTEWCLLSGGKKKKINTQGLSPYFLSGNQMKEIIKKELISKIKNAAPDEIFFYGTGCSNPANVKIVKDALKSVFTGSKIMVDHDLMGAAKSLC